MAASAAAAAHDLHFNLLIMRSTVALKSLRITQNVAQGANCRQLRADASRTGLGDAAS